MSGNGRSVTGSQWAEVPARTAGAAAAAGVLPACFLCPGCDYDLGGSETRVCPECGREVERQDLDRFARREAAAAAVRPLVRRTLWQGLGAAAVMSGGAMLLAIGVGAPAAGVVALVVCGIAVIGSISAGWLAATAAPRRDRAVVRAAWLRALPWLNAPWLMAPMFAAGGVALAFTGLVSSQAANAPSISDAGVVAWALGVLVWLAASGAAVAFGAGRLKRGVREQGVYPRSWWVWVAAAGAVVVVGALLLGAAGLMFATGGAVRTAARLGY